PYRPDAQHARQSSIRQGNNFARAAEPFRGEVIFHRSAPAKPDCGVLVTESGQTQGFTTIECAGLGNSKAENRWTRRPATSIVRSRLSFATSGGERSVMPSFSLLSWRRSAVRSR